MGHWAWWECLLGESVSMSHCWCMSFLAGPAPSALCLGLFQMKTGPFAEHSNQLWNISAVPSWSKVNQGLIRMYKAEVSAVGRGRWLSSTAPWVSSCAAPGVGTPSQPFVLLADCGLGALGHSGAAGLKEAPASCLPQNQSQSGRSLQM